MTVAEARAALAALYLRYISAPDADYEFEYFCYCDVLVDLADGMSPAGVVDSYGQVFC